MVQSLLLLVDRVSTWLGQIFAWVIVALTLMITWEVFSRYVLNAPHDWALDVQIMFYGTLFMMAGAYTLSRDGHVRGDMLYRLWRPRVQASVEFVLYSLLLESALDAQHFLDLVAQRQFVFEDQRDMRAQMNRAVSLVRHDLGAKFLALPGVRLQTKQAVPGDHMRILLRRAHVVKVS